MTKQKYCIYCSEDKPIDSFSREHIWPDSLGGDYLDSFWQTDSVCRTCNSTAGVFVDAKFIKSFFVASERWNGEYIYIDPNSPSSTSVPLAYIGHPLGGPKIEGEVPELYLGPCGTQILHVRPKYDETWFGYVSGDPRKQSKQKWAGKVYITLNTTNPFWAETTFESARRRFKKSDIFITNGITQTANGKTYAYALDREAVEHSSHTSYIEWMENESLRGESFHFQPEISLNFEIRFLAKLALAVGCQLFDDGFGLSDSGVFLRKCFREANYEKQKSYGLKGTGYLGAKSTDFDKFLAWPGGWKLMVINSAAGLALSVRTPNGKCMTIPITNEKKYTQTLDKSYENGLIWIAIPALKLGIGPIELADYIAHKQGHLVQEALAEAEKYIVDESSFPPCA